MKNLFKLIANSVYGKHSPSLKAIHCLDEMGKYAYGHGGLTIPEIKFGEGTKRNQSDGPEEWIWVDGYKGTDKNMCCRDTPFEIGERFDMPEDARISVCSSGFHLCSKLEDVYSYYSIGDEHRFFKVRALVRKSDYEECLGKRAYRMGSIGLPYLMSNDKLVAKSIEFVEECTLDEIFEAARKHYNISDDWNDDLKKEAITTNIQKVILRLRIERNFDNLILLGYSEALSKYMAEDQDMYERAVAISSQPDVSMDVRIAAIFCARDVD